MSHRRIPVTDEDHDARRGAAAPANGPERGGAGSGDAAQRPAVESGGTWDRSRAGEHAQEGDGGGAAAAEGGGQTAEEGSAGQPEGGGRTARPTGEGALREQLLRLAAEFDNYRKREARERTEAWSRAKGDLTEKLLPALDDLARVAHPEGADAPPDSPVPALLAGVELVEKKLLQTLEREGLARIDAEGEAFDPALHEAILTQPTDRAELDGRVAHVALPGYRFGDRLLRPAKVVVWKLQR